MTKDAWNALVEVAADDPIPYKKPKAIFKHKVKKPKNLKPFVHKPKFRKKLPIKAAKPMVLHKSSSKIEQDEAEIDYPVAEMESAQGRVDRILEQKPKKKAKKKQGDSLADTIKRYPMSRKRKHLLFMNPGDFPVQTAILAMTRGNPLPAWARPFRDRLSVHQGTLYWTTTGDKAVRLPFLMKDEKRHAVKRLYFDPREPSTIMPITLQLYSEFANVSRTNVTRVLKSLETYQLNFGRRRPPDIKNRFFMYNPGMLAMDMFFPSKHHGWEKTNVLCCMDTWSRYCGVYAIDTKRMADVLKAMNDFLKKFAAMGHLPRRILSDKGSDMAAARQAIEKYRQQSDGNKPMVLHTATGTPVLIVEGLNAQVQRRMAIFRTSNLIDSASQILHEIAEQLNNEPRQARGGLTPIQLLNLDQAGRDEINSKYRDKYVPMSELRGLPRIDVNDTVRLLKMTRKEQETNKVKGFAPKWSKRLYTVLRKTRLRKNKFHFRYHIGLQDSYYRHELQKVREVDRDVPNDYVRYKEVVIGGYDPKDDEEWEHSDADDW